MPQLSWAQKLASRRRQNQPKTLNAPRATMPNKGKSRRRAQRVALHAQSPCPRKRDQKRKPPPPSPSGLGCARTMTFRYDVDTTVSDESLVRWRSRPYKRAASKSTPKRVSEHPTLKARYTNLMNYEECKSQSMQFEQTH